MRYYLCLKESIFKPAMFNSSPTTIRSHTGPGFETEHQMYRVRNELKCHSLMAGLYRLEMEYECHSIMHWPS